MNRQIFILLLLTWSKVSFAQTKETNLVNITQQEGLPSNETYCIFKDSRNYIWIATDQGVVRYKGGSMQVINNLPDNVVFKIREDNKGRVWFFSHTGKLAYYFNEKLYPFIYNDSIIKYKKKILINDAYITDDNEILLNSTRIGHNFKITNAGTIINDYNSYTDKQNDTCFIQINNWTNNRLFTQIVNPFTERTQFLKIRLTVNARIVTYTCSFTEMPNSNHFGAVKSKDGEVFCWFDNYILKLKSNGNLQIRIFPTEILSAFSDTSNNTIILGLARNGIAVLSTLLEVVGSSAINNYSITSIETDNEGEIWFSTLENGVYYTKNSNRQKQFIKMISSAPAQRMTNVTDSFIVFANAQGIFKLTGDTIVSILNEKNTDVGDIRVSEQKNIYFSRTSDAAYKYSNQKKNNPYSIQKSTDAAFNNIILISGTYEIIKLDNEFFWLKNYKGGMTNMQVIQKGKNEIGLNPIAEPHIENTIITAAVTKDSNTFFLGTQNSLLTFNIAANTFSLVNGRSAILSKGITRIRQMQNGIYAIGIRFGGLALMQDTTVIGNITEADGLLSNSVKYILPIGNRLWLVTPNGISVIEFSSYQPLQYTITNFSENAGLNNMIIYQLISFKENIVAATSKGIYQLSNIEQLLKQAPVAIPLYITTLSYYKGDTSGIKDITLPYAHNRLIVNFDAICYNTPKEVQCYYRLLTNNDTTWHSISSTQIILENLAPGDYNLQIKAAIPKQHRYSGIQTLSITIAKPWWQWNLVRVAAILLLLSVVYLIYQWRINIIKKREKEKAAVKKQMTELEQTALRSQMNPHFIFNCLSSIQQLLVVGNKDEANEYLVKFARLIRKTLELSVNPYISLAQEKDYLSEYLVLEQLRIPDQFDFYFNIDKGIDIHTTEIPNMMLQPIIENCIRHGIKHLQNKKGKIIINITKVNNCLHCEISDNGVGRKTADNSVPQYTSHKSFGLSIVEKRLTGLPNYNPNNYFVKIIDVIDEDNISQGTKVILQLPFKITTV